ncbi:MAG: M13 family metallopeptidase [Prevotella sp.]|nr:M13 family metallopeptidase [Prevotella sp.]
MKRLTKRAFLLAIPAIIAGMAFTSCYENDNPVTPVPVSKRTGIDTKNFDPSVRPADDFYQYANGGWMKNNPLPAAYSRYGTFQELVEVNKKRIRTILEELKGNSFAPGSTEKKLSDLYQSAMNSGRRNQDGVQPLMGLITQMEQATTMEQLFEIQLQLAPVSKTIFMAADIDADAKNAKQNILVLSQGGTALGEKQYYLDTDEATVRIREAYKQNIVKMMQLFGFTEEEATRKMTNILRLETEMAKVSRTKTELRDPKANYNKTTLAQFETDYPHVQLEKLMNAMGLKSAYMQELVVGQPEYIAGIDKLIATMKADEYRDFMEWGEIRSAAEYLDDKTQATYFEFFGKVLSGRQEDYPLWQRVTNQIEGQMGEALGKIFVEKYFPAAAKERMLQLVETLKDALEERFDAQDWMSDATKVAAKEKLNAFIVKVGYPDTWTDMSALDIDPQQSYYENIQACTRFWNKHKIEHKAGKTVDPSDWQMTPQTVNAYYNPTTNEICFPAGILQRPFFSMEADDAFNYGGIGVVIGHEMTHGFDDQGRLYDKDGNMRDWWTAEDAAKFKVKADLCAAFFDAIEVLPGLHANGRMTLGENLADHGGLQVAWTAYKKATKDNPLPTVDGLTADQRFFLANAGVWAQNITESEIRRRTLTDVHSLGKWRINGAFPHIDAWYEVYGVKEGDKMYLPKSKRLDLW